MKKILLSLVMVVCFASVHGGNEKGNRKAIPPLPQPDVIDALDTVVLDLSQQVITGNDVAFPVFIMSDDTVYSLDFSFKYDQNNFTYDTIIDYVTYLMSYSYYNANDSTVRYTSNSLQQIGNNTPLVFVHFVSLLSGGICSPDLNTLKAYLNGELCSVKIINCSLSGINENTGSNDMVRIFPNPVSKVMYVEAPENSVLQLMDLNGHQVISQTDADKHYVLNTNNLTNGIYMLRVFNNNFMDVQKVVINK